MVLQCCAVGSANGALRWQRASRGAERYTLPANECGYCCLVLVLHNSDPDVRITICVLERILPKNGKNPQRYLYLIDQLS